MGRTVRRRGGQVDRRALLEEAFGALTMTEYGAMLDARHTAASYDRLVELAKELGMPSPPALNVLAIRGASDEWAVRAGLLHRGCRYERDGEHWAFHCRG